MVRFIRLSLVLCCVASSVQPSMAEPRSENASFALCRTQALTAAAENFLIPLHTPQNLVIFRRTLLGLGIVGGIALSLAGDRWRWAGMLVMGAVVSTLSGSQTGTVVTQHSIQERLDADYEDNEKFLFRTSPSIQYSALRLARYEGLMEAVDELKNAIRSRQATTVDMLEKIEQLELLERFYRDVRADRPLPPDSIYQLIGAPHIKETLEEGDHLEFVVASLRVLMVPDSSIERTRKLAESFRLVRQASLHIRRLLTNSGFQLLVALNDASMGFYAGAMEKSGTRANTLKHAETIHKTIDPIMETIHRLIEDLRVRKLLENDRNGLLVWLTQMNKLVDDLRQPDGLARNDVVSRVTFLAHLDSALITQILSRELKGLEQGFFSDLFGTRPGLFETLPQDERLHLSDFPALMQWRSRYLHWAEEAWTPYLPPAKGQSIQEKMLWLLTWTQGLFKGEFNEGAVALLSQVEQLMALSVTILDHPMQSRIELQGHLQEIKDRFDDNEGLWRYSAIPPLFKWLGLDEVLTSVQASREIFIDTRTLFPFHHFHTQTVRTVHARISRLVEPQQALKQTRGNSLVHAMAQLVPTSWFTQFGVAPHSAIAGLGLIGLTIEIPAIIRYGVTPLAHHFSLWTALLFLMTVGIFKLTHEVLYVIGERINPERERGARWSWKEIGIDLTLLASYGFAALPGLTPDEMTGALIMAVIAHIVHDYNRFQPSLKTNPPAPSERRRRGVRTILQMG